MRLVINAREEHFPHESMTVHDLIEHRRCMTPFLLVKVNGQVIERTRHADCILKDGDQVLLFNLVGGG
ncbi:MAG: sulfur carrier protein ThiS [Rectinemataceae bacterium]|nr:sulfur carrier protein ThiS [Spirochaetaceae bacterium]